MRFHYTFQKVVDLKSNEKTQAEWMLSSAIGELKAQESSLEQLVSERGRLLDALLQAAENCASMSVIREMQDYVDYLDKCIARKHADIDRANTVVESRKDELTGKMLDEKVWLMAKDKAKMIFTQNMMLREQNELDEMATVRFATKSL